MQNKDYYQILGVAESATQDEVKKAYREIAKKYHPDRNPGDKAAEESFKEAGEAYETLGNVEKRSKYDRLRKMGISGTGAGGFGSGGSGGADGMSYEDFMRQYGTASQRERYSGEPQAGGDFSFGDIFGNLFGGGGGARRVRRTADVDSAEPQSTDDPFFKRKGNDAYVDLKINIIQALLGSKVRVRTPGAKRVTVKIPSGTSPGRTLRIQGMGYSTSQGAGDLYIRMNVSIPTEITEEQKELVRQLAESLGMKY